MPHPAYEVRLSVEPGKLVGTHRHGKRNRAEYEGLLDVDSKLFEAVIRIAREIENRVRALGPVT